MPTHICVFKDTREKPFPCGCGQSFSRQYVLRQSLDLAILHLLIIDSRDLLVRHTKISHSGKEEISRNGHNATAVATLAELRTGSFASPGTLVTPHNLDVLAQQSLSESFYGSSDVLQSHRTCHSVSRSPDSNQVLQLISSSICTSLNTEMPILQETRDEEPPTSSRDEPEPSNQSTDVSRCHDSSQQSGTVQASPFAFGFENDFDFLWNTTYDANEILPASFFDSSYSLSYLWQPDVSHPAYTLVVPATSQDNVPYPTESTSRSSDDFFPLLKRLPPQEAEFVIPDTRRLPVNEVAAAREYNPTAGPTPTPAPWNISRPAYQMISRAIHCSRKRPT